jgi:DUF4097 and DUF4098 domain-containing protein YvlB
MLFLGFTSTVTAEEKYEEKFEKTVSLAKDGKVSVKNISGDIAVKTWNKAEVKIDALKVSKKKEDLTKVKILVEKEGDSLSIVTEYPKKLFGSKSINVSVDFKLMIPDKATAKVSSVSGDLSFENIGGTLTAGTVSGDVKAVKAAQGVEAKSVSGDVTVEGVKGDVELKSVSGDIKVEGVQGSVEVESVSGELKLRGVSKANKVKAKALSGDVDYEGEINASGKYSFKSHSGDIQLYIPANAAFDFEAQTFSGKIKSDFEIKISGEFGKREMQGSVSGGGAKISLSTFSGNVYLKKK